MNIYEKMRRNKWLCLLLFTACFILNTTALPILAAYTNVTARIEAGSGEMEGSGSGDEMTDGETGNASDSQHTQTGNASDSQYAQAGNSSDSQYAQTGDNSRPERWIVLFIISGCGVCGATYYGKKKSIL